jgi:arginine decarboxylase
MSSRKAPASKAAKPKARASASKARKHSAVADSWSVKDANETYNIERWGAEHFSINKRGHMQVNPMPDQSTCIDLMEIVAEARERGLSFPLTVRFQDLLKHRLQAICGAFDTAITEMAYKAPYRGVFPIKVNQLREVVEEIIEAGAPYHFGLEAGSKPELFAALAVHRDYESLIVCNGYKDSSFIHNALLGRKLGKNVIMVVEKLEELKQIVDIAKEMGVEPMIGVRVRLQSKGAGKWATSGGEDAKFGLSTADLVQASSYLHAERMGHTLRLIHFHVGSQVTDIGTIKRAVREAARFYAKLSKMGHALGYLDVGGGLGVDYDGSRTTFDSSMNYTLQEYARDVVYHIMDVCDSEGVGHPTIVSESGRALVAHHSVLIVEAFGSIERDQLGKPVVVGVGDHKLVRDIGDVARGLGKISRKRNGKADNGPWMEALHDAQQYKEQAQSMFELGLLDLETKARVETVFWQIAKDIVDYFGRAAEVPEEVTELQQNLADQYLCNFSIFQSLLDNWALGQLFPIVPVHHLNERPERAATLVDITCDSDGKIDKFIDLRDVKNTLPLHRLKAGKPYYLGIFLIGAYQDIMGDLHNLFGRVNEVHVFLDEDEDGGYYLEEVIEGSSISQVLALTQWETPELVRLMKSQVDAAIKSDHLKPNEGMKLLAAYERSLTGYTYLSLNGAK